MPVCESRTIWLHPCVGPEPSGYTPVPARNHLDSGCTYVAAWNRLFTPLPLWNRLVHPCAGPEPSDCTPGRERRPAAVPGALHCAAVRGAAPCPGTPGAQGRRRPGTAGGVLGRLTAGAGPLCPLGRTVWRSASLERPPPH